ncbi:MAG TPA: NAD(P)H-quinone oxidoreductase [Gemmatimonadaceae bacterium]|nr:NAD(P)H-quinone oxidoreductase [Gemmatimonadaceae bacterium]
MRAVVIRHPGGPDVLEVEERPRPDPADGELLVRVRSSALNRADLMQREGRYPAPAGVPADVPGIEFAGEVAALGAGTRGWRVGDRVLGLVGGGAHAEYLTTHADAVAPVPAGLAWDAAGATPEAFITAYDALVTQAALRAGERVLIHAVGSGVGLAAVQLVRALDAIPYGTSRTPDKVDRAREHGLAAGLALPSGVESLAGAVAEWTGGAGVDVVLDLAGGRYVGASVDVLAPRGRLMLVGAVAGGRAEIDVRRVLSRRLTLRGTVLRSRSLPEKVAATRAFAADVLPLIAAGRCAPVIDSVFPLEEVRTAHRRLEDNASFGKVVLRVG